MLKRPLNEMKIIIADDEDESLDSFENMLEIMGFDSDNIYRAHDGTGVLKVLDKKREKSPYFDLILCDWYMPVKTGIEVLANVRKREDYRDIPFIMITGDDDEDNIALVQKYKGNGYILKPFSEIVFKEKIYQCLGLYKKLA